MGNPNVSRDRSVSSLQRWAIVLVLDTSFLFALGHLAAFELFIFGDGTDNSPKTKPRNWPLGPRLLHDMLQSCVRPPVDSHLGARAAWNTLRSAPDEYATRASSDVSWAASAQNEMNTNRHALPAHANHTPPGPGA